MNTWIPVFLQALDSSFPNRVWFVGLQGSYGRGEATQSSDIDMVVILDKLTPSDIQTYNTMLQILPNRELLCGFLSGKEELLNWEASDLFQFYYDTTPIRGSLDALLPLLDEAAIRRAVKIGACNIFHSCVHNMLYEKRDEIIAGLYKGAAFVLQAICFLKTGNYYIRQADLLPMLSRADQKILQTCIHLKNGGAVEFTPMSDALLIWAQSHIQNSIKPARQTDN